MHSLQEKASGEKLTCKRELDGLGNAAIHADGRLADVWSLVREIADFAVNVVEEDVLRRVADLDTGEGERASVAVDRPGLRQA